jgi:microcystin-dependent protein
LARVIRLTLVPLAAMLGLSARGLPMIDRPSNAPFPGRPTFGGLPVGAVSAYAGPLAPEQGPGVVPIEAWGWMLCDGRTLPAAQYPELFAVLGTLYGGSDGAFCIPDYRGTFLRGTDHGSGNDPDARIRTTASGGTADGVGSTQRSAMQDHGHNYKAVVSQLGGEPGAAPGGPTQQNVETTGSPVAAPRSGQPVGTSQHETRPANVAVNYIIKFTSS